MAKPTHGQKLAVVLWAQGFNARAIGDRLGVSDKAIYRRLERVKKRFPEAMAKAKWIRRHNLDIKFNIIHAMRFPAFSSDRVSWERNGDPRSLKILRKF